MGKEKKLIGLSAGRRHGNSEILLKEALMAAEELGLKTEIIRATDLRVKPCTGCETCTMLMAKGKISNCIITDDDVEWVLEKTVVEDSALIISTPIYHLVPNGLLTLINHRMLPILFRNPRVLKKTRVGGIICVGGGEPEWTPLGLLNANIFLQHTRILVDQIQVNYCGRPGQVLAYEHYLRRARKLGENVARATSMPPEKVKFKGDDGDTVCPVCHCDVLKVPDKLPQVVCPICQVNGVVTVVNGKMAVVWDPGDVRTPRFSEQGIGAHAEYIANNMRKFFEEQQVVINKLKQKYANWGNLVTP
ncbi:MAG: flavodoxin family protein [Thermodesulfobacteriota bacterium]